MSSRNCKKKSVHLPRLINLKPYKSQTLPPITPSPLCYISEELFFIYSVSTNLCITHWINGKHVLIVRVLLKTHPYCKLKFNHKNYKPVKYFRLVLLSLTPQNIAYNFYYYYYYLPFTPFLLKNIRISNNWRKIGVISLCGSFNFNS